MATGCYRLAREVLFWTLQCTLVLPRKRKSPFAGEFSLNL
jgi:hypothetical protein